MHWQTSKRTSGMPRKIGQILTNILPSFRGNKNNVPEGKSGQRCREIRKGHDAFDKLNIKTSEGDLEYLLPNYIPYFTALNVELPLEEDPLGMKLCSGLLVLFCE
jgi:hypothetical protein